MTANRTTGALAREIRDRLTEAQARGPSAPLPAAPSPDPTNQQRVTKDGRLVRPGEPIPTDERGNPVPTSIVPDGTFHSEVRP